MQIPAPIQLYLDRFNQEFTGQMSVRPDGVKVVDGVLSLVATATVLGHDRQIFVSNEECEAHILIDDGTTPSPAERSVFREFGDDIYAIIRDRRISGVIGDVDESGS
jgi:hypothetical protein